MRQRGFSMLELLLVLVILGLAYRLAAPALSDLGGGDLKASARTVAVALKRARTAAISGHTEMPLTFDLEARTLTLATEPKPVQLPRKLEVQLYTVEKELASEKIAAIRFYPDGSSTGGRVTLAQGERKFDIDVDWLTGRVRISQPES